MPDPAAYDSESEWMSACVSTAVEEGREQDQAVAMCLEMWRNKGEPEGEVEKADTHRNAAKRALREILSLLEDKAIPEKLRGELEDARDALRRTWGDLEAEADEVANMAASTAKATKKEQDGEHPASHYLVVEDPEKPTTWHLRVRDVDGNPDHRLMGAAWAALHGGYRGNRYEGPDKETAIGKLKRLYQSEDMDIPGEEEKSTAQKVHNVVIGTEGVFPVRNEEDVIAAYISAFRQSRSDAMQELEVIAKEHGWQNAIAEARKRTKALITPGAIPKKEPQKNNPPKKKLAGIDEPSIIQTVEFDGNKALSVSMIMTKAERMSDGRIRWQARANTGEWDLERERFDVTFWDDLLHNFSLVQEATTKGSAIDLPVPILDIAHYSFRLPTEKRHMARVGYPIKLWRDGKALMAQGYFDNTPLGVAAAIAAQKRPVEDRRVSIGVWPDWGRVELDNEHPLELLISAGHRLGAVDNILVSEYPRLGSLEERVKGTLLRLAVGLYVIGQVVNVLELTDNPFLKRILFCFAVVIGRDAALFRALGKGESQATVNLAAHRIVELLAVDGPKPQATDGAANGEAIVVGVRLLNHLPHF